MKFIPNGKRLLVQFIEKEETTSGGFIVVTQTKSDLKSAKVVKVSPELDESLVGKDAFFREIDGVKISLEGSDFFIVESDKILGYL